MSAWPRESDATVAVEAAAKAAYEAGVAEQRSVFPPGVKFAEWDDLDAVQKLQVRESVLPVVWAALSALPDPRRGAWYEGYLHADNGGSEDANPYEVV